MRQSFTDDDLRELMPRLRRFAVSLTRNEASADDLVQSCLERALSRQRPHAEGDLRAWLFQIMYRRFLDGQRRARRYATLLALLLPQDPVLTGSTEELVLARAALADFNQLAPEQRALLLLVSVEGLSYQDAATTLDIPIGTVMSRLSRARRALRELNEGKLPAPALRIMK